MGEPVKFHKCDRRQKSEWIHAAEHITHAIQHRFSSAEVTNNALKLAVTLVMPAEKFLEFNLD